MTRWSYTAAPDKTLIIFYDGVVCSGRSYQEGKLLSEIDQFLGTVIHEKKHVSQIAKADKILPTNGSDTFRYGWSWNSFTRTGEILERTAKPWTNGMTRKNRFQVRTFCCALLLYIGIVGGAHGLQLVVPSPDEMIQKSSVIVIGRFTDQKAQGFVVDEILKAPFKADEKVTVVSPLPRTSFPLEMLVGQIGRNPTIVFGSWNAKERQIGVQYGVCSFWPQGAPQDYLETTDLKELRSYLLEKLKH